MSRNAGAVGDRFDYIIVGSGSAGSVLANRLTRDPACKVLLIEAGPSDRRWPINIKTLLPIGNIFLLPHALTNWQFTLRGNAEVGGRTIGFPRGKLFGGCSSINGGVYIRGQRADYEGWAQAGNAGWAWDDVIGGFTALENYHGPDRAWHGKGGELDVEKPASWNPVSAAIVDAAAEAGHDRNDDFAGPRIAGFGRYDLNQRRGTRLSTSRAFLRPAMKRPNLTVLANTLARRVLFDRGRAVAIETGAIGGERVFHATREIILCGGAINTPQLLMLSGIGPAAHLAEHGIAVLHDLPGVGAHLQDHPTVHISVENPSGETYALSRQSIGRILLAPVNYVFRRKGMFASNVAECGGFVCTDGSDRPDIQITFLAGLKANARIIPSQHGFMALVQLLRPKSEGSVRLASGRPEDKPVISPNFFADPYDMKTLIAGFRAARRIFAQRALARFSGAEIEPGADIQSDTQIDAALRKVVNTAYHPTGTCKMGPDGDPMAVVDTRLRVRGVSGLRVVDASVMPAIISGNTSAPTMMIAERAAGFIREDATRANT